MVPVSLLAHITETIGDAVVQQRLVFVHVEPALAVHLEPVDHVALLLQMLAERQDRPDARRRW